jgi:multicomponent Na+:H+ antiporter subunit D
MNQIAPPLYLWLTVLPAVLPLMGGALCVALRRHCGLQRWLALIILFGELLLNIALLNLVEIDTVVSLTMGNWLPPFGISFTVDMLSAVLALTATTVGIICCLYALQDVDEGSTRFGFYPMLLVLIAGMNGAFLTGDIFNLYVWLEILLISSFGLMILGGAPLQLDGAVKYAFLNLIGTTIFLIATGLLYGALGTLNFADLIAKAQSYPEPRLLVVIALLYLTALVMKAAGFPLFFWLPASYHTPQFVVSALFAALLTKVGVYGIYRIFSTIFAGSDFGFLNTILVWIACLTMVLGACGALAQNRLRPMLGYVVISGIGYMLAGYALTTDAGRSAGIFYMLQSMLVMSGLYLLAGLIGGRHMVEGDASTALYASRPMLAACFLILAAATAGLPPFPAFWSKFALVRESLGLDLPWLAASLLLSGFLVTIALARSFAGLFWTTSGPAHDPSVARPTPAGSAALIPAFIVVLMIAGLGLFPDGFYRLSEQAASGLSDYRAYIAAVLGGVS